MKNRWYLLGAPVIALLAGCGPSPAERLARADDSFADHRFGEARLDLLTAIEGAPEDTKALTLLARTQLELGDGEAALSALHRLAVLKALPQDAPILRAEAELLRGNTRAARAAVQGQATAEAWRVRALAAMRDGDATAAAEAFTAGSKTNGPKARLMAENARFLLLRGDGAGARRLAEAALAEDSDVLEAHLAAGQVAGSQGRFADALATYETANTRWPESRAALIGRIASLGDLGRVTDMAPSLKQAAERAPGDPALVYLQARLAAANKDWAGVRRMIQPLEGQMAALPQAQLLYGQALIELGLHNQGSTQLAAFLRHDPGHRLANRMLATAQLQSGNAGKAVATLKPFVERGTAGAEDLAIIAIAAKNAGLPEASRYAAQARDYSARGIGGRLAIADAALKRGDWGQAAQAYRRILEVTDSTNVMVLNNLAFAESKLGNADEALRLARKALALAPQNASVLDTAGWLMIESGAAPSEGRDLLRKAARLAPGNQVIAGHLAAANRAGS